MDKGVDLSRVKTLTVEWETKQQARNVRKELSDIISQYGEQAVLIAAGTTLNTLSNYISNGSITTSRLDRIKQILYDL